MQKRSILLRSFILLSFLLLSCAPQKYGEAPNQLPSIPEVSPETAPFSEDDHAPPEENKKPSRDYAQERSPLFTSLQGCEEKESVTFTHLPLDLDKITVIEPQGELTGFVSGHITPGDHVGYQYDPEAAAIPVYALADGHLVRVERNPDYFGIGVKNYHLYFEYSCSMFGSYIHITEIAPELLNADPRLKELDSFAEDKIPDEKRYPYPRIPVKAGQLLGKAEKWGLLGMLTVDTSKTLTGFVNPKLYDGEPWKVHAVPAFDYFAEPLKTQLMQKNPRTAEPRGGKIDFDVDGKLAGNWFLEGTDYAGDRSKPYCGDYLCPYWNGHLAFVPDFVTPVNTIRVSIGYDAGLGDQGPYGVDSFWFPSHVTVAAGPIKYELLKLKDITAERGFTSHSKALITENTNEVLGTLLVQLVEARKLKMEVFPRKKASEVSGFSGKEKVYVR